MQPFVFSFDLDCYYGLEMHAGPLSFDVFRGYLIDLLREQAKVLGRKLSDTHDHNKRPFRPHKPLQNGTVSIELSLEDDEYAFAQAVGSKLRAQSADCEWEFLVIKWLLKQEGVELWASMPRIRLDEGNVTYELDVNRGVFLAQSAEVSGTGESMALPPTPYRFK